MTVDSILGLDYHPRLPANRGRGIGIIGAGSIVNAAHLPAYRRAGFNVVGLYDANSEAAERTARAFGVTAYVSPDELIDDPNVEIVDIAIIPQAQIEVASHAIDAGKHVLCQKPLAERIDDAVALVERADRSGVRLAVNQQMRWDQVIRCTKMFIDAGWYGELTSGVFDVDIYTPWESMAWVVERERVEFFIHSIHYFDSMRFLFGEPVSVLATTARYPGQVLRGETRSFTVFEFTETLTVTVLADHNNWSSSPHAVFRCRGTDGQSDGTFGSLYDYPHGRPDTFTFRSRTVRPDYEFSRRFDERWIPDAFVGPMAELHLAIEEDREPLTSGRDNLATLGLVHAAYASAEGGHKVMIDRAPLA